MLVVGCPEECESRVCACVRCGASQLPSVGCSVPCRYGWPMTGADLHAKLNKEDPCSAIMAADQDSKIGADACCPADTGDFADNAGDI